MHGARREASAVDMILYGAFRREIGQMWSNLVIVSTFLGTRARMPEMNEELPAP